MKNLILLTFCLALISCNQSSQSKNKEIVFQSFKNDRSIESGYLEVPENRTVSKSKKIKLAYIVIKARNSASKKDPILYLQGGPGAPTLIMANFWKGNDLRNDRDIVLMDQRGTGASNAICSDFGDQMLEIIAKDLTPDQEYTEMLTLLDNCKDQANKNNTDLSGYNSRENAADYEALRKELGYKKWNVFGGSYGSRLGLTIMRDFPNNLSSINKKRVD